jgi:uncharacterized protein (DUF2062 family)
MNTSPTPHPSWLRCRLVDPTLALLRQGITPPKLALCFALGIVVGCFPVLGLTTLLCAGIALALRLNLPAIQLANWIAYPLQLAVLIPLYRAGEWLFRVRTGIELTPDKLVAMFRADLWGSIVALWDTTLHAIAAWTLLAGPAIALVYLILLPIFRRLAPRREVA